MTASTVVERCEACTLRAQETALENYLDANVLRWPDMDRPGTWRYEELTFEQEAELATWVEALLTNEAIELGWHEQHVELYG